MGAAVGVSIPFRRQEPDEVVESLAALAATERCLEPHVPEKIFRATSGISYPPAAAGGALSLKHFASLSTLARYEVRPSAFYLDGHLAFS